MPDPTTMQIDLTANAIGTSVPIVVAAMDKAIVPAEADLLQLLGCTVNSDNTAQVGVTKVVRRRIILSLNIPPLVSVFKNNPLPRVDWLTPTGFTGSIVSTSDEDGPGGAGTLTVNVSYKDLSGGAHTELGVVLNGTKPVNLTNPDKVLIVNVQQATGGAQVNRGILTVFSGTTAAKFGTSVAVAVVPQPVYRLVTTPDAATMTPLFQNYMKQKLATALGIPILASVPVFA